ncbi:MAG: metallophosphoesterase [Muribaculaceae bacterium]
MRSYIKSIFFAAIVALLPCSVSAQSAKQWKQLKSEINLFMANDLGRNGYYDQKTIAGTMGEMAEAIGPESIIAAGDVHHFNGVASVSDPLWLTNYELIYSHPELMIDWHPILGNHEYRGNTGAVLDYSSVSRRWVMPARYYTRSYSHKGTSVRVIYIDTTPLISKYRTDSIVYPDACRQDAKEQLRWIDSTLTAATEQWVIVVGHHPIYAQTAKADSERTDLQQSLLPILQKHSNVAVYACGHIHNFQHITHKGDNIDYVVNSAGSLARKVQPCEGTQFCSPLPGFSVIAADAESLKWHFIDKDGNVIYTFTKKR